MINNPFVQPLQPFDPKKDLLLDETFHRAIAGSSQDALADLLDSSDKVQSEQGKEKHHFKTSDAVTADIKSMVIDNTDFAVCGNKKGHLYFFPLNPAMISLKPIWKINVPGTIFAAPAVRGDMAYIVTREGVLFALHIQQNKGALSGKMLWKKGFSKGVLSQPILTRKMLIVSSLAGMYAFDIYNGKDAKGDMLWHENLSGIVSTPLYEAGQLFLATEEKKIYAYGDKGDSVALQWSIDTNDAVRMTPYSTKMGNFLIAASIDGTVYCLDKSNGRNVWIFVAQNAIYSNILSIVENNREYFFFGDDNGYYHCLDASGKEKWQFKTQNKIRGDAIYKDGILYFGSYDNHVYALDAKEGKLIFKFATEGNIYSKPLIWQDHLLVGSGDSLVYMIKI